MYLRPSTALDAFRVAILRWIGRMTVNRERALVLTDFEFPPQKSRGLSCLDVMDLLTRGPELDELDPILATGSSFLVDDDLWVRGAERARAFCQEQGWASELRGEPERGYIRVQRAGAQVATRDAVRLATHWLEQGFSRCLIGTRALLGEGWDCRSLNTLVDLTVVTSGVATRPESSPSRPGPRCVAA